MFLDTDQGILTFCLTIATYLIPMSVFMYAVLATKPVPTACLRCDSDVAPGLSKCPSCGAFVPAWDQPL